MFFGLLSIPIIVSSQDLLNIPEGTPSNLYNNVGKLYYADHSEYHRKSVTFYRGRTCFTTANLSNFYSYEVEFEIGESCVQRYRVERFIQHPNFLTLNIDLNYSLTILILDRPITELSGLSISDELPEPQIFEKDQYSLTYVGYSTISEKNQQFASTNGAKKILQVPVKEYAAREDKFGLFLEFYRGEGYTSTLPYHFLTNLGMWGGGAFDKDGKLVSIIGISEFYNTGDLGLNIHENFYKPLIGFYSFLVNVTAPYIPCITATPHNIDLLIPGIQPQSVPLKPLKKWIDDVRKQYDDTHLVDYV